MRLFYAFVLIIVSSSWLDAQIEIQAPTYNLQLKNQAQQKANHRAAVIREFKARHQMATSREEITENTIFVITGQSDVVCHDTTLLTNGGGSYSLLNCSTLNHGTVSLDSTCMTYASNPGVTLGRDTVCVEFCKNATDCDTLIYPIIVKRPNGAMNVASIQLEVEDNYTYCADMDTLSLPGDFSSASLLSESVCGEYTDFGTSVTQAGLCFMYEAGNFSESDAVCFLICDNASVCDTLTLNFDIAQDTLGLPFFDDFNYLGPYPSKRNWLDENVFVNPTFGNLPPSVGVATFDGLNSSGSPYGGGDGFSDALTSAYLDLSGVLDTAYLSYYIQSKGNGDKPEVGDSLVLEYKNNMDVWVQISRVAGLSNNIGTDSIPPFLYQAVSITGDYLYNGFQFRFRNKSSNRGSTDLWNLDYVQVSQGAPNATPDDIAFVQVPTPLLKDYTSMPWRHFSGFAMQELDSEITAVARNISDNTLAISDSKSTYNELVTGSSNLSSFTIFDAINGDDQFVADELKVVDRVIPQFSTFSNDIEAQFSGADSLVFETVYTIVPSVSQASFRISNDTVVRQTVFSDYFAYDDGTAESGLAAKGSGTQIAVKFHTNVVDSLRAVQMHIPHFTLDVSNQLFNLKVWIGDLDTEPVFLARDLKPVYVDTHFDSIQGFTTYRLQDYFSGELMPVQIPAGDFYIGWEQVSNQFGNDAIPVGYDRNNPDAAQFISINTGQAWEPLSQFTEKGALMLRPVFGTEIPPLTDTEDLQTFDNQIDIYPNPSKGIFFINLEQGNYSDFNMEVFTATGQSVYQNQLTRELNFDSLQSGVYFIKITNFATQRSINKKIIIIN